MDPRSPGDPTAERRRPPDGRSDRIERRLRATERRMRANERRLQQVECALDAVAQRTGNISVSHACTRCEESLLLVENGEISCPRCTYRQPL